jgi:hypothetical protein
MVAEGVEVLSVTVWGELKVPPAGLSVGVAAGMLMVYEAEAAVLVEDPVAEAMAWSVSEADTLMGPV